MATKKTQSCCGGLLLLPLLVASLLVCGARSQLASVRFVANIRIEKDPGLPYGAVYGNVTYEWDPSATTKADRILINYLVPSTGEPLLENIVGKPRPAVSIKYKYGGVKGSCSSFSHIWTVDRWFKLDNDEPTETVDSATNCRKYLRPAADQSDLIQAVWIKETDGAICKAEYTNGRIITFTSYVSYSSWPIATPDYNTLLTSYTSWNCLKPTSNPASRCLTELDLVIVMDEIVSQAQDNIHGSSEIFRYPKALTLAIANMYNMSAAFTQIGVIFMSDIARTVTSLSASYTTVSSSVGAATWRGDTLRTQSCFSCGIKAAVAMLEPGRKARSGQKQAILFMADYQNTAALGSISSAMAMVPSGVSVYAIGLPGNLAEDIQAVGVNGTILVADWVSVFDSKNYKNLNGMNMMLEKTCGSFPDQPCGGSCLGICGAYDRCSCPECPTPSDQCITAACSSSSFNGCKASTISCDDNLACTVDHCSNISGCFYTEDTCDDNDPCTIDSCDNVTGCSHVPNPCDDGLACTVDSCNTTLGGCQYHTLSCDDGDACTVDICSNTSGCGHRDLDCDDSRACTIDQCDSKTGCYYTLRSCNDSSVCTVDTCNNATGCKFTSISCDDGKYCTEDSCDPIGGCQHETVPCDGCLESPINCNAGLLHLNCHIGSCSDDGTMTGKSKCNYVSKNTTTCANDNKCERSWCDTTTEGCRTKLVVLCAHQPCHTESCDPETGDCLYTPYNCSETNGTCIDDVCYSAQQCDATNAATVCNDDDACTVDSCGADGKCQHLIIQCPYDICTKSTCDKTKGCVNSTRCDDNNKCTLDSCDLTDGCLNVELSCDDSDSCTEDSCNKTSGCVHTKIPGCTPCDKYPLNCSGIDIPCFKGTCADDGNGNSTCVLVSVTETTCNSGDKCAIDSCDNKTGKCDVKSVVCDHKACKKAACNSTTGKCDYTPVVCTGSNLCLEYYCDETIDACASRSNNMCKAGNCTTSTCYMDGDVAKCKEAAVECNSGNACVIDSCDWKNGNACVKESRVCDDHKACTINHCNTKTGCYYTANTCDDGDPCTDDSCVEPTGCKNVFKCKDKKNCTIDTCNADGTCVYSQMDCSTVIDVSGTCYVAMCSEKRGCFKGFSSATDVDVCGGCITQFDANGTAVNASATDTSCLAAWEIATAAVAISAGIVAAIVIGVIVIAAIVIASATAGTYELVRHANAFKNSKGTVENPLYESSTRESSNPLYDAEASPSKLDNAPVELSEVAPSPQ